MNAITRHPIFAGFAALVVAILAAATFAIVPETEQAVILRLQQPVGQPINQYRPGEVFGVGWQNAVVWNWRYPTNDCLWFQVTVRRDGTVQDAGKGIDPRCDGPADRHSRR